MNNFEKKALLTVKERFYFLKKNNQPSSDKQARAQALSLTSIGRIKKRFKWLWVRD